jgi:hypothetical protein
MPTKTIGIVPVSRWRAKIAGPTFVKMLSGCKQGDEARLTRFLA